MPPRTSLTDPLKIDAMPCGNGLIGMTLCPGKHASSAFGTAWARDLALDLNAVVDWGATSLVSLVERHELSAFRVSNLGEAAEEAGLEWHHLPIKDVHIPDERFERRWPYSGHVLRRRLQSEERIVLHCRGGLGRTGTIAARLAIELGETPETALRRVRAARRGAVETHEQEAYVLQKQFSVPDAGYADRVLGCLLGGAVGDAFGYGVEFTKLLQIRQRFGPRGIQQPVVNRHGEAEVSDDTQMTLFTLEGLLAGIRPGAPIDRADVLEAVRQATLDWYGTQIGRTQSQLPEHALSKYKVLRKNQAPGGTCLRACQQGARGTPEQPINHSKGCGGVMRVAPIGLFPEPGNEQAFELAARCAAQTHGHPSGYLSAGVLASMVRDLLDGVEPERSARRALDIARHWQGAEETVAAVEHALELAGRSSADHAGAVAQLGEGWIGEEALAVALYAALVASDFSDAMRIASNHDGDSDSTASIAGQVYGAWKGLEEIPNAWIRRLDALDPLLDVTGRLIGVHS